MRKLGARVGLVVATVLHSGLVCQARANELTAATDFPRSPTDPMVLDPEPTQAATPTTDLELEVERVEVDVLALDRDGNFVPDLRKEDFELSVEDRPVEIIDFSLRGSVSVPAAPDDGAPSTGTGRSLRRAQSDQGLGDPGPILPAPIETRRFTLFVDLLNSGASSVRRVQPALLRFVSERIQASDRVLLSVLASDRRLLILARYSDSRERLEQVVQSLVGNASVDARDEDREKDVTDLLEMTDSTMRYAAIRGAAVDLAADLAKGYAVEDFHSALHAINALSSLAETIDMGGNAGPNVIVYVSDGLAIKPAQRLFEIINKYAERLPPEDSRRRVFDLDLKAMITAAVERLNRSRSTIYALDARGPFESGTASISRGPGAFGRLLSSGEELRLFMDNQQTLNALAADTGGRLYANRVEYDESLAEIELQTRARYYLTFKPDPESRKGSKKRFHEIRVRCLREGVKIQARKGYFD